MKLPNIHSTWILHGREVIYCATAKGMVVTEDEDKKRMVNSEKGLWYLRAAHKGITENDIAEGISISVVSKPQFALSSRLDNENLGVNGKTNDSWRINGPSV